MDGDLAIRTDGYGDAILNDDLPVPADGLVRDALASETPATEPVPAGDDTSPTEAAAEPAVADEVPAIVFAPAPETEPEAAPDAAPETASEAAAEAQDVDAELPGDVAEPLDAPTDLVADAPADAMPAADAPAAAEDLARLESLLESLLLAAGSPVPLARLVEVVDGPARRDVVAALRTLGERYEQDGRGMRLVHVAGGWQLRSAPEHGPFVRKLLGGRPPRLSRAMMETLAIVAYRQPCTKPEIEAIRGVDADATLNTLLERRMVRITGRKEAPGRPLLYATTREFLEVFGLPDLNALPPLAELGSGAELLAAPDLTVGPDGVHPTPAAALGFTNGNGHDAAAATAADADASVEAPTDAQREAADALDVADAAQGEATAEAAPDDAPRADDEAAG